MLSHGRSVIPNFFAKYWSHDKVENFVYKVCEILISCHITLKFVENLEKKFKYGYGCLSVLANHSCTISICLSIHFFCFSVLYLSTYPFSINIFMGGGNWVKCSL